MISNVDFTNFLPVRIGNNGQEFNCKNIKKNDSTQFIYSTTKYFWKNTRWNYVSHISTLLLVLFAYKCINEYERTAQWVFEHPKSGTFSFKNDVQYMKGGLSNIRSVHTYATPWIFFYWQKKYILNQNDFLFFLEMSIIFSWWGKKFEDFLLCKIHPKHSLAFLSLFLDLSGWRKPALISLLTRPFC